MGWYSAQMMKRMFNDNDSLIKPSQEHVSVLSVDISICANVGFGAIKRKYSEPVYDGFHVHADDTTCVEEVDLLQKEEVDTLQKDEESVEELQIPRTATVKSHEPLTVKVKDKKFVEVVDPLSIPDANERLQDQVHHSSLRVAPEGVTTVRVVQSSIDSLMESLLWIIAEMAHSVLLIWIPWLTLSSCHCSLLMIFKMESLSQREHWIARVNGWRPFEYFYSLYSWFERKMWCIVVKHVNPGMSNFVFKSSPSSSHRSEPSAEFNQESRLTSTVSVKFLPSSDVLSIVSVPHKTVIDPLQDALVECFVDETKEVKLHSQQQVYEDKDSLSEGWEALSRNGIGTIFELVMGFMSLFDTVMDLLDTPLSLNHYIVYVVSVLLTIVVVQGAGDVSFGEEDSSTGVAAELYGNTLVRLMGHQVDERWDVGIHRWSWLAMTKLQVDLWNYVLGLFKLRLVESYISRMLCQAVYTVESCDRFRVAIIFSTSVRVYLSERAPVYQLSPSDEVSVCHSSSSSCQDRYQLLWMEALLTNASVGII